MRVKHKNSLQTYNCNEMFYYNWNSMNGLISVFPDRVIFVREDGQGGVETKDITNEFEFINDKVYTRDEVEKLIARAMNRIVSFRGSDGAYNDAYKKFIEENL